MTSRSPRILLITILTLTLAGVYSALRVASAEPGGAQPGKTLPLAGEQFLIDGRPAFVIPGHDQGHLTRAAGIKPWVWYAPTLPGLPSTEERWMFERFVAAGIAVAGVDVGESYGSPAGRHSFSQFYEVMTKGRGYSSTPVLLGRSRGGLMTLSWAAENADKVAGFAGIYPVCNLSSYPGVAQAAGAYGLSATQLERQLLDHNPVDRLAALAFHDVPLFAIHGDVDTVVPLENNSGLMKERYDRLGGPMQLMVPKGQGHNMWSGFFECQELVTFVLARATPEIRLLSPMDYQVIQRPERDRGQIVVTGVATNHPSENWWLEARLVGAGVTAEWAALQVTWDQRTWTARIEAPAGGWYRLEVRSRTGSGQVETLAQTAVEHVGIGEVFVIAGQSNAANHGERRQATQTGMVTAFDGVRWQLANDPQPGASGDAGSFMPSFGDHLARQLQVPVGIVACGVGATSVREWLPAGSRFPQPPTLLGNVEADAAGGWRSKGAIFATFAARMKPLGPNGFRAVLWHQGESDANQADPNCTLPGELYREYLTKLIAASRHEIGWDVPWFVAQASYHTPLDPGSPEIRAAQAALWGNGTALEGPDTDALDGPLRDQNGQGVHFSDRGLQRHGELWAEKVGAWLSAPSPRPPATGNARPLPH